MDHRTRVLAVVILTFVISLSIGFVTEYIRQSMTFSWAIAEGDEFTFDLIVIGYTTNSSEDLPLPFVELNNTRIRAEIVSLPNVSIIFYPSHFLENIVEHTKIGSFFENGTNLPSGYRIIINRYISQCVLPIGGWLHLDSFFPNQIKRPYLEYETYLSGLLRSSFYFGYSSNTTYEAEEWHGIIDLETGVPLVVSFWFYRTSQARTYWYNVTMSLVT